LKCATCDLPLSPTRTICPRCGTPRAGKQSKIAVSSWVPSAGTILASLQRRQNGEQPQVEQETLHSAPQRTTVDTPFTSQTAAQSYQLPPLTNGESSPVPDTTTPHKITPLHTLVTSPQVGFAVAGLCVILAGLLLAFVSFMTTSPHLLSSQASTSARLREKVTPTASLPTATPTVAFPGLQYIDNVQTASAINLTTAEPTQLTTSFRRNQRIYVTLDVHSGGQAGAMCLHWLLNDKEMFAVYGIALPANISMTYSYATYGIAGSGAVEVSWASTSACKDPILAQVVSFTVSP